MLFLYQATLTYKNRKLIKGFQNQTQEKEVRHEVYVAKCKKGDINTANKIDKEKSVYSPKIGMLLPIRPFLQIITLESNEMLRGIITSLNVTIQKAILHKLL